MMKSTIRDLIPYGIVIAVNKKKVKRNTELKAREKASQIDWSVVKEGKENKIPRINFGCGTHLEKFWWNIDLASSSDIQLELNDQTVLPFGTNSIDVVFSEHFIEHVSFEAGKKFIQESIRVLKPGGVFRCCTPDLDCKAINLRIGKT